MTNASKMSVLIVDNHPVMRQGLALLLAGEPDVEVIGQADDGKQALEMYRTLRPDITLMDLRMPVMDGIEAISCIRADYPAARIILLSTYDSDEDVYRGIRAGAWAYLLKDAPFEDVLNAIRAVHAGKKQIGPEMGVRLAERIGASELTERELQVVALLVEGKSNQEIGSALFISEGTVKFHMNHILNKLDVEDRTQAVIVALKRGIAHLE